MLVCVPQVCAVAFTPMWKAFARESKTVVLDENDDVVYENGEPKMRESAQPAPPKVTMLRP